jgi:co-chaperonin GroES (HSP10)
MRFGRVMSAMLVAGGLMVAATGVMMGQATAPKAAGTVKSTDATGLTLTTAAGQDVVVTIPATAKVLVVAPGSKDLKSATEGSLSDVTPADKVIVLGTAGDTATALTAVRVILMKQAAIAQSHAAEDAAWTRGGGGIVKSVDAGAGTIEVASGPKMMTVTVGPSTVVRRYSGDSVKFEDAKVSTIGAIQPGDQLRVRGTKSADGMTIAADELVTGSFKNYSGLIEKVDATAGTITLKDLTTKKTVTVAVTANSDVRRIPAMVAARVAMSMKAGSEHEGAGAKAPAAGGAAPAEDAAGGARRAGRAGMDLSSMLSRLPVETLAGLKTGDAVMIVATTEGSAATAVTLLAGVEAILTASPDGQSMTLSPWSLSGGDAEGGMQGGSAQRVASPQ